MENNILRQQLFLAALLHDLESIFKQEKSSSIWESIKQLPFATPEFDSVKEMLDFPFKENSSPILQKAFQYAIGKETSSNDSIQTPDFVESIFPSINRNNSSDYPRYAYAHLAQTFAMHEGQAAFFPKPIETLNKNLVPLLEDFLSELKKLKATDFNIFTESLLNLMEAYLVTIPGLGTAYCQDISLFDHSRFVAAYALCLYDSKDEAVSTEPVLMIGGDLSGIQSYIYEISGKNASKNLKGRSFYLQMMIDNVVQSILRSLNLSRANLIYSSGGGFFILAPNTKSIQAKVGEIRNDLSDLIYQLHQTKLFLALDSLVINEEQLLNQKESSPKIWKELLEKLNKQKRQRFSKQIMESTKEGNRFFFEPFEEGGQQKREAISNEEMSDFEIKEAASNRYVPSPEANIINELKKLSPSFEKNRKEIEEYSLLKRSSYKQIKLGRFLRDSQYIIVSNKPSNLPNYKERSFVPLLPDDVPTNTKNELFEYYYLVESNSEVTTVLNSLPTEVKCRVLQLNPMKEANYIVHSNIEQATQGFLYYGGNEIPHIDFINEKTGSPDPRPKEFDELAGIVQGDKNAGPGIKKLGVLRMDVDSLGQIFVSGFDDQVKSFTRYAVLSRSLDYYFKGFLNKLHQNKQLFEHTNIIYAGGDDLFLLGRWDKTLEFAWKIQQYFGYYTCNNPHLSISGGLVITSPKFPITQGASYSEDAEKEAKGHKYILSKETLNDFPELKELQENPVEKNSLSFLNNSIHWKGEYPIVNALKNDLVELVGSSVLSRGFLNKIATHYQTYSTQYKMMEEGKKVNESWRWTMAYDVEQTRNRINKSHIEKLRAYEFLEDVKAGVFGIYKKTPMPKKDPIHNPYLELLNLAARWAELELRMETKQKSNIEKLKQQEYGV